jgi:hypothetical protein
LEVLLHHLEDDPDAVRQRAIKDEDVYEKVGILRLDIDEMSGKQGL